MTVAAVPLSSSPLNRPVTTLYGVGPERAAQLERLGIRTLEELLLHRPSRYEDRAHLRRIAEGIAFRGTTCFVRYAGDGSIAAD